MEVIVVKKTLVTIFIVVALVLALGVAGFCGYIWYRDNHVFVEGDAYDISLQSLDLTDKDISVAYYDELQGKLPDCEITWSVPFQDRKMYNTVNGVSVAVLTLEDVEFLAKYFPNLEFVDGSILAQLSSSDMCFPIQYAVTWPERLPNSLQHLNLAQIASLKFETPRWDDFPALTLARTAGLTGGTMPAMYNAANEVAVQAFVDGKLSFPGIWETVEKVLSNARPRDYKGQLPIILEDDAWAREEAIRIVLR